MALISVLEAARRGRPVPHRANINARYNPLPSDPGAFGTRGIRDA